MPVEIKKHHTVLKIVGIAAVILVALIVAIPFLVDANQFRPKLESELTSALGREVTVGNLKLSVFSGGVAADDIAIADDPAFSRSPFLRAKSFRVGVELWPLLSSRVIRITAITLDEPQVILIHSPSGQWNFSSIGGKPSGKARGETHGANTNEPLDQGISVGQLKISNGRVTLISGGSRPRPHIYDKVDVQAHNLSYTSAFPFKLTATLPGGGSVGLEGNAGPVNTTDASLTPVSATLDVKHFDVVASGIVDSGAGLAGILDFNGSLMSDGRQMQSKGEAKATKFQIVKGGSPAGLPVVLDYNLNYNLKNQSGTLEEAKVGFGKSVARLNGAYDMHGESTVLKMKLRGDNMPADDLEALLPAIGLTLPKGASLQGGTLNADLTIDGPAEKLVTSGNVGLLNARLAGFDLGSKMATVASLAGIKPNSTTSIDKFASELRVAPDGIQSNNLVLVVPGLGELTGNGIVGSNSSLDFRMQARLTPSGGLAGSLIRGAGNQLAVPFFIRGTTSNPSFVPDVKGAAGNLIESVISGKGKSGESGKNLGDTLKGLFGKKKQP